MFFSTKKVASSENKKDEEVVIKKESIKESLKENTCGENGMCCGMACDDCPCKNGKECMASSCKKNYQACECCPSEESMSDSLGCASGCCGGGCDESFDNFDQDFEEVSEMNDKAVMGQTVNDFNVEAYHDGKIKDVMLSDYADKWVVLFFYPADFTFVCPTELEDMSDYYKRFQDLGAEVLSVSTDSVYAHKAWHDSSDTIKKITFPMLADPAHNLTKYYGVLSADGSSAMRGTFVIDPDGVLRIVEINDDGIGRNAKELYRKLQAAKFVRENGANVCPAKWEPGDDTLIPSTELVGKI